MTTQEIINNVWINGGRHMLNGKKAVFVINTDEDQYETILVTTFLKHEGKYVLIA